MYVNACSYSIRLYNNAVAQTQLENPKITSRSQDEMK